MTSIPPSWHGGADSRRRQVIMRLEEILDLALRMGFSVRELTWADLHVLGQILALSDPRRGRRLR